MGFQSVRPLLQVCDDPTIFVAWPEDFILEKMTPLANLMPAHMTSEGADPAVGNNSDFGMDIDLGMMEDNPGLVPVVQRQAQAAELKPMATDLAAVIARERLVFTRCSKNFFNHMTIQGQRPEQFDVFLQTFFANPNAAAVGLDDEDDEAECLHADTDAGTVRLLHSDLQFGCTLTDVPPEALLEKVSLWRQVLVTGVGQKILQEVGSRVSLADYHTTMPGCRRQCRQTKHGQH